MHGAGRIVRSLWGYEIVYLKPSARQVYVGRTEEREVVEVDGHIRIWLHARNIDGIGIAWKIEGEDVVSALVIVPDSVAQ